MSTEATTTETRAAKIEAYAGKAAELTRKFFTQSYSAADSFKAFFATPKASTVAAFGKAKVSTVATFDKAKVASKDLIAKARAKAKSATAKNGVAGETPAAA